MSLIATATLALSACYTPQYPGAGYGSSPRPILCSSCAGGASPEPASPPSLGAPPPTGPQFDSLTLHNDCTKTVKLFVGDRPKWGSGTSTSIGSNTTQSYTLDVGKMIWIVDDNEKGLAQYTGQAGTHRIKIPASCTGFVPY